MSEALSQLLGSRFTSTLFTEGLGRKANILNNPNTLGNGFRIVDSIGSPITLNPANGDNITLTLVTNELGQQCGGVGGNTVLEQEGVYFLLEDSTGAQGGQVAPWQIRTTDDTDSFFGSFTNTSNYYDNIFYGYNQAKRVFNFTFQITFNGTSTSITKKVKRNSKKLDVIKKVKDNFKIPVLAYQVSGEYLSLIHI